MSRNDCSPPATMSEMAINEMVRRRVGLRLGSLNEEDHRNAHRIHRHRSGQGHLSPGCIRRAQQGSTAEEVLSAATAGLHCEPAGFIDRTRGMCGSTLYG